MVSIIIPVYNTEKYIERCLLSVACQTYSDFECLCIDDGSTDQSGIIIQRLAAKDSRFCYLYQQNAGPSAARNRGLEEAKGKYILFVDSDDTIEPDYLEKLVDGIEKSEADICCCGYTYLDSAQSYKQNDYPKIDNPTKNAFLKMLFSGTGGTVCSKLFRTAVIRENQIKFDKRFFLCEDQLFALEFYCASRRYASIESYGYNYNKGAAGLSTQVSFERWHQQLELLDLMEMKMRNADVEQSIVDECADKKFKNTMLALVRNVVPQGKDAVKELLDDPKIAARLKKLRVKGKSDMKWMLPVKLKLYSVIFLVYGR